MLLFVYGGSGSGKSKFAEELILRHGPARRLYIATMEPFGEDAEKRIARHRELRAGKGFETLERSRDLSGLAVPQNCAALLEDLTNLFANEWFGGNRKTAAARVLEGLKRLEETSALTVIVANDLFADGMNYDMETVAFLEALAALHRRIAEEAEAVCEVVCGIPIFIKGRGFDTDII